MKNVKIFILLSICMALVGCVEPQILENQDEKPIVTPKKQDIKIYYNGNATDNKSIYEKSYYEGDSINIYVYKSVYIDGELQYFYKNGIAYGYETIKVNYTLKSKGIYYVYDLLMDALNVEDTNCMCNYDIWNDGRFEITVVEKPVYYKNYIVKFDTFSKSYCSLDIEVADANFCTYWKYERPYRILSEEDAINYFIDDLYQNIHFVTTVENYENKEYFYGTWVQRPCTSKLIQVEKTYKWAYKEQNVHTDIRVNYTCDKNVITVTSITLNMFVKNPDKVIYPCLVLEEKTVTCLDDFEYDCYKNEGKFYYTCDLMSISN